MRKFFFLTLLLLPFLPGKAQRGFVIGVQGGGQLCWMINRQDMDAAISDYKYLTTGGYGGMFKLGYNWWPNIGIHSGVVYSSQGQKNSFVDSTDGVTHIDRRSITYLKIPVLLHISSTPEAPVTVVVEAGPQFSFLQNAWFTRDKQDLDVGIDPTLVYEKKLIELAWGIGAEIRLSDNATFTIMHRGDYNFFDTEEKAAMVSPGVKFYPDLRFETRNLNLGLMAGFNFNWQFGSINKYDKRLYWKHKTR